MTTEDLLQSPESLDEEPPGDDMGLTVPGDDEAVAPYDSLTVISAIEAYKQESEGSRLTRDRLDEMNYAAMHSRQDMSGKVKGQSREFLPKVPMALEQLGAFIKRGLTSMGDYFATEFSPSPALVGGPLSDGQATALLKHRLEDQDEIIPGCLDFPTTVADATKTAAIASLFVLKVHGHMVPARRLSVDVVHIDQAFRDPFTGQVGVLRVPQEERLSFVETNVWRLVVEAIRPADYFPDPTGRKMYEIHRTWKDLYTVVDLAEAGEYDKDAVAELAESCMSIPQDADFEDETNQPEGQAPSFRKEVEIWEFWGNIVDSDGNMIHRNVRAVIANGRYLIRRPEPNPNWHQQSPFVVTPLLRVPFSTWHRALFDDATRLNLAANELFNLMTDGALGSVWGVRQVKMGMIENPEDFSDGIPQGATVLLKDEAPDGVPAIQVIKTGDIPQDAMAMYNVIEREFQAASMITDTKVGLLPKKEVRATEVNAAEQASSTFFDAVIGDIERAIQKALRLAWLTMLQNADDWMAEDVVGIIGEESAKAFAQMSPARRYLKYGQGARFKAFGLSSLVARSREFQKLITALGAIQQSPMLQQAFMMKSSPDKLLQQIFKALNINMDDLKLSEEEKAGLEQTLQQLPFFQGMARGAQGAQQPQGAPEQTPGSVGQAAAAQVSGMAQMPQTM